MTSPAERAALAGGILLAAGLVTAAILYFWPQRPPRVPPLAADSPGTAAVAPLPPVDPYPPPVDPERETQVLVLRKEITRLRGELLEREEEIEALKARLREAGIELEPAPEDAARKVEEAIAKLWQCGTETSPSAVEALVLEIVQGGKAAVKPILATLESGKDLALADGWMFTGGGFTAYPTLRVALLSALRKLSRVEGVSVDAQSALVSSLRNNDDPLEICLLVGYLEDVRSVATVESVLLDRAHRFLELPPFREEVLLVSPLLRLLAGGEPEAAAESLVAFLRPEARRPQVAELALERIEALPAAVAVATLARVAGDPGLGEKAVAAAARLAGRSGVEAVRALAGVLPGLPPKGRRDVYLALDDPVKAAVSDLVGTSGLEARERLDAVDADLAAREELLAGRMAEEREPWIVKALDTARGRVADLKKRAGEMRARLEGE